MKALCQPDEHGVCTQCLEVLPFVRKSCPANIKQAPSIEPSKVKEPNIVKKATSMCAATGRWHRAGSPTRTQARVLEVLSICQVCPHIRGKDTENQRCGVCGCPINSWLTGNNKLLFATESCPDPKGPRWHNEPYV